MRKRKRNDIAWQFCTVVDDNVGRVRCNFCGHVMWGGVTRLKHHLACIKGNVIPCRCCPPHVVAQIQKYLGESSQKNEESMDGGSEQVNDVRDGGNEGQSPQDPGYWHELMGMAEEYLNHVSPKSEENINGGSVQVNDMRGGGNKEQLQPEQDCWQELSDEIHEYVTQGLQNNEENIDGGSVQVNDMSGEGNEEQLQLKQECWRKSAGDDMFLYLFGEPFRRGWEARNLGNEMELKLKIDEEKHALEAVQRVGELTFWGDGIRHGEGCSGTKPVPSYQEYGMSGTDSDDSSELGF